MQTKHKEITRNQRIERLCREWLLSKKIYVKESTYNQYYNTINNHILPLLLKIDNTTNSTIVQDYFYLLIQKGYSNKTIHDILSIIKSIDGYFKKRGINLGICIESINTKRKKTDVQYLDICSQKNLSSFLLENLNNKTFGILLALYTGIRIGELCALKWEDIDLKSKTLTINKTLIRIQNHLDEDSLSKTRIIITSPKSNDSIREIPLPDFIVEVAKQTFTKPSDYVLSGSTNYIEPRNMQYYFQKVLIQSGTRSVNFHALRHTFATRCIESNFDVKTLSEILGHSNVRITLDKYVHSTMELKRKNMEKLSLISF
jgi:integrase